MKFRLNPFVVASLAVAAYFAWFWGIGKPRPSARLETPLIDLGVVVKQSTRPLHFSLRNTGNVPLRIASENHDCGCVKVSYPHDAIAPGQAADLTVQFTAPNWAGDFKESLRVQTSPETQEFRAEIKGMASPPLVLESPGWMPIGGKAGTVKHTVVVDHRTPPGGALVATVRGPDAGCLAVRLSRKDERRTAAEVTLRRSPTHGTKNFYIDFADPADPTATITLALHPL